MTRTHTNAGISVYEQRPDCPASFHDSYTAVRRAGCVCPAAKEAKRIYFKRQAQGRLIPAYVDPTGTRRRIHALAAIGHPIRTLGAHIGWRGNISRLLSTDQQVHRHTRDVVAAMYERLSGTPGASRRARLAAQRAGYPPPLAWEGVDIDDPAALPDLGGEGTEVVDEVAVRRALAGEMPFGQLRRAEKAALFRDHAGRYGTNDLASRLHVSGATIRHWREQVAA